MRIKAKLLGSTQHQDFLKQKKAVLPISVSHLYHEGEKFISTLELIKNRFSECDVIVSDTLQRHNLLTHETEEKAALLSFQAGTEWIERNIKYFKDYPIPYHIIRWNECLNSPGYTLALDKIHDKYQHDISLQLALDQDIHSFIGRDKLKRSTKEGADHCRDYLFEEAAVVISYFVMKEYDYIVYPSSIPYFIYQCRELFVSMEHPKLIRDLRIYFKKIQNSELIT